MVRGAGRGERVNRLVMEEGKWGVKRVSGAGRGGPIEWHGKWGGWVVGGGWMKLVKEEGRSAGRVNGAGGG